MNIYGVLDRNDKMTITPNMQTAIEMGKAFKASQSGQSVTPLNMALYQQYTSLVAGMTNEQQTKVMDLVRAK